MRVTYTTPDGRTLELNVIDFLGDAPDFPCDAPHTEKVKAVVSIDRGVNFHGELIEDLYLVLNRSWDSSHFVLWCGDNGSQNDDETARIFPVAWCETVFDDEPLEIEAAVEALLFAYVYDFTSNYEHFAMDDRMLVTNSDPIREKELQGVFQKAVSLGSSKKCAT